MSFDGKGQQWAGAPALVGSRRRLINRSRTAGSHGDRSRYPHCAAAVGRISLQLQGRICLQLQGRIGLQP